jgi:hypothetical protein
MFFIAFIWGFELAFKTFHSLFHYLITVVQRYIDRLFNLSLHSINLAQYFLPNDWQLFNNPRICFSIFNRSDFVQKPNFSTTLHLSHYRISCLICIASKCSELLLNDINTCLSGDHALNEFFQSATHCCEFAAHMLLIVEEEWSYELWFEDCFELVSVSAS